MTQDSHVHNSCLAGFGQRAFAAIQSRPYGKLVGDFYNTGNAILLASGAVEAQPHKIVGAIAFIASGVIYSLRGNDDRWVAAAAILGAAGMVATNFPVIGEAIQALQITDPATFYSTIGFVTGNAFGALKPLLETKFKNAKNLIVKNTLGRPRSIMGVLSASSKACMFYNALTDRKFVFAGILALWITGDYFVTKSTQPRKASTRQNAQSVTAHKVSL